MSLRIRLVLLIVALVALLTIAVAVVHLNSLGSAILGAAVERGDFASQQVQTFLIDHINQHSEEYETPAGLEETKALWNEIVSTDRDISNMLVKMVALTTALVEINVATTNGQILASSDPSRVGGSLRKFEKYEACEQRSSYYRLRYLLPSRPQFELTI